MRCGCGEYMWVVHVAADVLWMSGIRGMRGLVKFVRCVCVWPGACGWSGG